jgi:hypothetical protein
MITFSSRIASFVFSGVSEVSSSPACSSSPGRKAPACVCSVGACSVGENSVGYQYKLSVRAQRRRKSEALARCSTCSILGGAHLRYLCSLTFRQLELTGLVEGPGLLHVLDELEQPRSTCRSTYSHISTSQASSLLCGAAAAAFHSFLGSDAKPQPLCCA